jgi:hypothetical protein
MEGSVTLSSALERDASTKFAVTWVASMPHPQAACGGMQRLAGVKRLSKQHIRHGPHQRHAPHFVDSCRMV